MIMRVMSLNQFDGLHTFCDIFSRFKALPRVQTPSECPAVARAGLGPSEVCFPCTVTPAYFTKCYFGVHVPVEVIQ